MSPGETMMTDQPKKVRGVYESPKSRNIWWIQYFHSGKRHRERVGRRSDAIRLLAIRKADMLRGKKLPVLNRPRVTYGELLNGMLEYIREHDREMRSYAEKIRLTREEFGNRTAEEIKPEEFSRWIPSAALQTPPSTAIGPSSLSYTAREFGRARCKETRRSW